MQTDFDGSSELIGKRASDAVRVFSPRETTCACHAGPEAFLTLLLAEPAPTPWTEAGALTRPHHWTCAAVALQALEAAPRAQLSPGEAAVREALTPRTPAARRGRRGPAGPAEGTLALFNGKVFTADPARPWAKAVAIRGGTILAAGDDAEVLAAAGPDARTADLRGRLVVPGFNDAHMHHTPDPQGVRLPLDPMADPGLAELEALVCEAARATAPGTWIYGVIGARLINEPALDRVRLDAWAPGHPLILLGFTNHTNVLNSAALAALGIADEAPDPVGGVYRRLPGGRRLSGRIDEYAQWTPQRAFAAMASIEEGAQSIRRLSDEYLRHGVTSVQNMSWTAPERYLAMLQAADVPLRVRLIRFPPSGPQGRILDDGVGLPRQPGPRISVGGAKWILDGTPVERGAALGRRYADASQTQGRENFSRRDIGEMLRESLVADEQLLLHAIGSLTLETVICALEADDPAADWGARGLRIEHGDGLTRGQIDRVAALGVRVVQNPSHFLLPQFYGPRFGEGAEFGALADLVEAGVPLAIGSDGPLNPFVSLLGAVVHPARPDQAVGLAAAVSAYTHGSACAEGLGAVKGRLAAGFQADLAVLSQDIFEAPPADLPATVSLLTLVDGEVAYEDENLDVLWQSSQTG